MQKRGKILYRERAQQINDFSGLVFGDRKTITPTDIDGFIEYQNKCFVFIELKLSGASFPVGQNMAYTRLALALDKPATVIVASHTVNDTSMDVDAANAIVEYVFFNGTEEWNIPIAKKTVLEEITLFIRLYGG